MSHNVDLHGVKINDLDALRQAVAELNKEGYGCSLDENASTFRTYTGQSNQCDLAIKMADGRHDIGLVKNPDGSYTPRYDPYDFSRKLSVDHNAENFQSETHGSVNYDETAATRGIGKLLQRYAVCKVEREAAMGGQTTQRSTGYKGVIEITVSA